MAKRVYTRDNMLSLNKLIERTERNFKTLRSESRVPAAEAQSALVAAKGWREVGSISDKDLDKLLTKLNTNRVLGYKNTTVEISEVVGIRKTYDNFEPIDTMISTEPKKMAGAINEGLARHEELGYRSDLWKYLMPAVQSMAGSDVITNELRHTKYYDIDNEWSGDWTTLEDHIKFKTLPTKNKDVMYYLTKVFTIHGMNELADDIFDSQVEQRRVTTFIENNTKIDSKILGTVAVVLDQSHMWAIASKDLPYKYKDKKIVANAGSHRANYLELTNLYSRLETAFTDDSIHMAMFKRMIDNEESMETIVSTVNDWLREAYKG